MKTKLRALALLAALAAILPSCTHYNPSLYPSYDVLNPSPEVRLNPISISEDPLTHKSVFTVNQAFILWVDELKQEILKLRKK